jgi:signal transduction histidine kinase
MRRLGNLRSTMTGAVVALALLAILTAVALVELTSVIQAAGRRATVAAENVRVTEAMQRGLGLLFHEGIRDHATRVQIEQNLRDRLRELRPQVTGSESIALATADRTVSSYLAGEALPEHELAARHAAAVAAVDVLLALELDDLQQARATAHRVDELADAIGMGVAAIVMFATGFLVWWLNARALRPLFGLAQAMRRFGRGDMEARAVDEGPAELAEMARRFNEMASAITQQRKDRQAFIAGIVHDLRTPLSVLRMSADIATTSGAQLPPERVSKVMGTVARQVTRLERMAGDLLESVTLEAGKVTLRTEEVDARDIATDIAELYGTTSAKHTISLEVPDEAVTMACDRMRIEQILSNLLSNAIKYSPEGGTVGLQLTARGDDVVFVVSDEGVGMNEADAAMVFEPFRRSSVLRDEVPGSGLGLFIVRRLVEAHGGRIELRTAPGSGSTFEVRIPARSNARVEFVPSDDEEPHRVLHVPH